MVPFPLARVPSHGLIVLEMALPFPTLSDMGFWLNFPRTPGSFWGRTAPGNLGLALAVLPAVGRCHSRHVPSKAGTHMLIHIYSYVYIHDVF